MKLNFTFKHLDRSESLEKYAKTSIEACARFLLKEHLGHVTFSKHKHKFSVEITIHSKERHFRAMASDMDPYHAVDIMVEKLEKQLLKVRRQVQHHKSFARSKEGRLATALRLKKAA